MFCRHCGKQQPADPTLRFCQSCGNPRDRANNTSQTAPGTFVNLPKTISTSQPSQYNPAFTILGILIGIVGIFIGVAFFYSSHSAIQPALESTRSNAPNTTAPKSEDPTAAPMATEAATNGPSNTSGAEIGGLKYTISNVSIETSYSGGLGEEHTANGQFIIVAVSVTNVGTEPATNDPTDFHLKAGERTYDATFTFGAFGDSELNPGLTHSGSVAFDVPAGSTLEQYALQVYGRDSSDSTMVALAPALPAGNQHNNSSENTEGDPVSFVRSYYALWNAGKYSDMFEMLAPEMRQKYNFPDYAKAHAAVPSITVTAQAGTAPNTVLVHLISTDRNQDGTFETNTTDATWTYEEDHGVILLTDETVNK